MAGPKLFVITEFDCINRRLYSYNEKQTEFFHPDLLYQKCFCWIDVSGLEWSASTQRWGLSIKTCFSIKLTKTASNNVFTSISFIFLLKSLFFKAAAVLGIGFTPSRLYKKKDEKSCKHWNNIFLIVTNSLWTNSIWFMKYEQKYVSLLKVYFNCFILSKHLIFSRCHETGPIRVLLNF